MKFKGNGVIWNPEEGKPLARFEKGIFETEDPDVIAKLKKIGIPELIEEVPEALSDDETFTGSKSSKENLEISDDFKELRKLAKAKHIPGYMRMTKDQLKEELNDLNG